VRSEREEAGKCVPGSPAVRVFTLPVALPHLAVAAAGLPAELRINPAVGPWKYAASEHNERMHTENTGSAAAVTLQTAALRC